MGWEFTSCGSPPSLPVPRPSTLDPWPSSLSPQSSAQSHEGRVWSGLLCPVLLCSVRVNQWFKSRANCESILRWWEMTWKGMKLKANWKQCNPIQLNWHELNPIHDDLWSAPGSAPGFEPVPCYAMLWPGAWSCSLTCSEQFEESSKESHPVSFPPKIVSSWVELRWVVVLFLFLFLFLHLLEVSHHHLEYASMASRGRSKAHSMPSLSVPPRDSSGLSGDKVRPLRVSPSSRGVPLLEEGSRGHHVQGLGANASLSKRTFSWLASFGSTLDLETRGLFVRAFYSYLQMFPTILTFYHFIHILTINDPFII
jgi:hypothetical protein